MTFVQCAAGLSASHRAGGFEAELRQVAERVLEIRRQRRFLVAGVQGRFADGGRCLEMKDVSHGRTKITGIERKPVPVKKKKRKLCVLKQTRARSYSGRAEVVVKVDVLAEEVDHQGISRRPFFRFLLRLVVVCAANNKTQPMLHHVT